MSAGPPIFLVGVVGPLAGTTTLSGIDKRPVAGALLVGPDGFVGDAQADRRNHGGPDKAIHHYPFEHYAAWEEVVGRHTLLRPGGFGENISMAGTTEADVHIGDVLRLGSAVLQVSQGRQPCWKLNLRFGHKGMAREVQTSGRTGWYYRVLEQGTVAPGDRLSLIDRPLPDWPLSRITRLLYQDRDAYDAYEQLAVLPHLADDWRGLFAKRLAKRQVEDWSRRLEG